MKLPFAALPLETSTIDADGTLTLRYECPLCHRESSVSGVDRDRWQAWRHGITGPVTEVFPHLTDGEREILKTGVHPACWDLAFSEEALAEFQDDDALQPYNPE